MRGHELLILVDALRNRPDSLFHAAVSDWKFPLRQEGIYQLDLMDLLLMRWTGDKFKPLARPWDKRPPRSGKSPEAAMRQLRPHLFKD